MLSTKGKESMSVFIRFCRSWVKKLQSQCL